jgi:hypothetical protein
VLKERIPLGIQESLPFTDKGRDPIGIIPIDPPGKLDEFH